MFDYYWYVIKDNKNMTYEVLGPVFDDREYDAAVCKAQKNGHDISSTTANVSSTSLEELCNSMEAMGFKYDNMLSIKIGIL